MELGALKKAINGRTRFIAHSDGTLTVTDFTGGSHEGKGKVSNSSKDGFTFGKDAKKRLKCYLLSAQMNGDLKGKNVVWATFTFTNTEKIKEYQPLEHDSILIKCYTSFLNNLKINHGLKEYVFVTERHTGERALKCGKKSKASKSKIGWLHFHSILVFDSYKSISLLNYLWLKKINHELQCEYFSKESISNYLELLQSYDKKILIDNFNFHVVNGCDTYGNNNSEHYITTDIAKVFVDSIGQNIQKSKLTGNLRDLDMNTYNLPDSNNTKQYNKLLLNPVDCEFNFTVEKILNYITKYITKSDNATIYGRVWQATRLFSKQPIKKELTSEEFNQITEKEKDIYKITDSVIEMHDKITGEIREGIIYTVLFKSEIYKNELFTNCFNKKIINNSIEERCHEILLRVKKDKYLMDI